MNRLANLEALYAQLSDSEKAEFRTRLDYSQSRDSGAALRSDFSADESLLLSGIGHALRYEHQGWAISFAASYGRGKLRKEAEKVGAYVKRACGGRVLRVPQRDPIYRWMFVQLRRNALGWHPNPALLSTPKGLMDVLVWLPGAVDQALPGYASAGMLDRVASRAMEESP